MNPLIIIAGLPETGKTTAAQKLEQRLEGYELHTPHPIEQAWGIKEGVADEHPPVWMELYNLAQKTIEEGKGAIVEVHFVDTTVRESFYMLTAYWKTEILILECTCSPEEAARRLEKRLGNPPEPSPYTRAAAINSPITLEELNARMSIHELNGQTVTRSHAVYDTETGTIEIIYATPGIRKILRTIEDTLIYKANP
ncbi:AAA family ATPase [Candidatus Woesearchaeota archaeon]|nr:AAA family ATPase [Candidatus Woesearchaeota archaeon]